MSRALVVSLLLVGSQALADDGAALTQLIAVQQAQLEQQRAALEEQRKALQLQSAAIEALRTSSEAGDNAGLFNVGGLVGFEAAKTVCAARSAVALSWPPYLRGKTGAEACAQNFQPQRSCAAVVGYYGTHKETGAGYSFHAHPSLDRGCDQGLAVAWPWAQHSAASSAVSEWGQANTVFVCCQ